MTKSFFVPSDVPPQFHNEYRNNYQALTRGTDRIFLFAADHKIEHLDADFHGPSVDPTAHDPKHIFSIASKTPIGALATQLGLIARFAPFFHNINYVAKLNSKTNLMPASEKDPFSRQLWMVDDVISLKNSGLPIRGIGLTVYLGSEYEDLMLAQASQSIFQAHQNGLVAFLWMYPRSKYIKNERDPYLLAGAAGVAAALGADVVKLHPPDMQALASEKKAVSSEKIIEFIVQAAGNTKVIIAGGEQRDPKSLLSQIEHDLSHGTSGVAIGRNIFEHSLEDAVDLAQDIASLIYST